MQRGLIVLGILLALVGVLFYLQGTGLLPFGGMANHIEWAYIGGGLAVVAGGLLVFALRRRSPQRSDAMQRMMYVVAALLGLMGLGWIAQGTGLLPFGGRANHIEWAYIGGVLLVVAAGLVVYGRRSRRK